MYGKMSGLKEHGIQWTIQIVIIVHIGMMFKQVNSILDWLNIYQQNVTLYLFWMENWMNGAKKI